MRIKIPPYKRHVVKMPIGKCRNNINGVGNNQKQGYYNYFVGIDQNKWASNVRYMIM